MAFASLKYDYSAEMSRLANAVTAEVGWETSMANVLARHEEVSARLGRLEQSAKPLPHIIRMAKLATYSLFFESLATYALSFATLSETLFNLSLAAAMIYSIAATRLATIQRTISGLELLSGRNGSDWSVESAIERIKKEANTIYVAPEKRE